jgi:flagellin
VFGPTAATALTLTFQAGILSGQTIGVTLSAMDATGLAVNTESLTTFTASQSAITTIDASIEMVNSARSTMGATMNQLSYSADNMVNISTNIAASRSTIMDTEYATASATLSKAQIIQQAATAMLAQANQQPQSVLSLIK